MSGHIGQSFLEYPEKSGLAIRIQLRTRLGHTQVHRYAGLFPELMGMAVNRCAKAQFVENKRPQAGDEMLGKLNALAQRIFHSLDAFPDLGIRLRQMAFKTGDAKL